MFQKKYTNVNKTKNINHSRKQIIKVELFLEMVLVFTTLQCRQNKEDKPESEANHQGFVFYNFTKLQCFNKNTKKLKIHQCQQNKEDKPESEADHQGFVFYNFTMLQCFNKNTKKTPMSTKQRG